MKWGKTGIQSGENAVAPRVITMKMKKSVKHGDRSQTIYWLLMWKKKKGKSKFWPVMTGRIMKW